MSESKRFEEYPPVVECNDCNAYWLNQCDGVPQGSERRCNSFSATRKVVIPAKINSLEKRFKWLNRSCILTDIVILMHLLSHILGWE